MNNHQKGYRRDRLVLETLAEWGTLDTEQLTILFYPSSRVAQRRLKILVNKGKVKRYRDTIELPYAYCIKHYDYVRLALNWLRIWLIKRLKSWETIELFDYAANTCTIRNTVTDAIRTYNVFYGLNCKSWLSGETIVIYDTDEQRRKAERNVKGTLLTIEEVREGFRCVKCS